MSGQTKVDLVMKTGNSDRKGSSLFTFHVLKLRTYSSRRKSRRVTDDPPTFFPLIDVNVRHKFDAVATPQVCPRNASY